MNKKCIICGADLHHLISIDNMPASAQDIPDKDELENDKAISLDMCQCKSCGLVQLDTEPVAYYKDVIRAGGGTRTMRNLRHEEYQRLLEMMEKKNIVGRNIIEVGCGRGEFLQMWLDVPQTTNLHICGIENKKELVDEARKNGLNVHQAFAEDNAKFPEGPFDAFVQFNFLEHQPDPINMLRCIYNNLKEGAVGLVTVPSFEYIMEYDGYYELIRDHIANYDERTLKELFERAGFDVLEERIVNRDTIEIIVEKSESIIFKKSDFDGNYTDVRALLDNYAEIKTDFQKHMKMLEKEGKTIAIWGAGHQGFTLAATTDMLGKVKYIIDSAKFKQGKFAPASHVPIVEPDYYFEDPVDEILIVAPGYTEEIADIIKNKYGKNVKVYVLRSEKITEYVE